MAAEVGENYGIRIRLSEPYGAVVRVRDELKEQGFGVLTEIDFRPRCGRNWIIALLPGISLHALRTARRPLRLIVTEPTGL